jgi:CO dehydrogenase maturation factor
VKIAVVGKGGSGKTMVASTLAYVFAQKDNNVYAIDADPNPTLGQALGFPEDILSSIKPIISLKDLIRERTGAGTGNEAFSTYFRLNPKVDDIPERYSGLYRSIRLLIMGATRGANTGCACTENTILKALVNHLVLQTNDTVIMDMVAGTEHIGRGTASGVNAFIIVVEPSIRSIQAAQAVILLIEQFANSNYKIIGNKIKSTQDEELLLNVFSEGHSIDHFIQWNKAVIDAENDSVPVYDRVPEIVETLTQFVTDLEAVQNVL